MPWTDDGQGAERLERLVPKIAAHCRDRNVTEIQTNPHDGFCWVDTWSDGLVRTPDRLPPDRVEMFLNAVATAHGTSFGPRHPLLAAELPAADPFLGARLQAFGPPVTAGGFGVVIRKRPSFTPTLDEYVERGRLRPAWREVLGCALADRETVVIAGATGSGKTTLLRACMAEIHARCPDDRLVILEDTPELHCPAANHLALRIQPGLGISFAGLLKETLRASPRRIILGEVRDEAALDFLDAAATGHPGGLCTTHAGSAHEALHRLDRLAQRANVPSQRELIGEAVGLVLVLSGGNQNRRVADLVRVAGFIPGVGFDLHHCSERGTWTAA
jgi:type IV secretion system protein VirB11